jgi:hypothetical protein
MKKSRIIIAVAAMIFLIIFAYGSTLRYKCTSIDGCTGCWQMAAATVVSDLCPGSDETHNESCVAEPYLQQHNAIIDTLLCACEKATSGGYADSNLNSQIEDVVRLHLNYTLTASEVCDNPGLTLVKMRYW